MVVVFGFMGLQALYNLLTDAPALIVDEQGIVYTRGMLPSRLIPWSELSSAHIVKDSEGTWIHIRARDPNRAAAERKLPMFDAMYGCVVLEVSQFDIEPQVLATLINRRIAERPTSTG